MGTPRKTETRLDTIPPQLCTRAEACAILGLKRNNLNLSQPRFANLRHIRAIVNGYAIILFNRAQVEAIRYPTETPADYMHMQEIMQLFNNQNYYSVSDILKRSNTPRKLIPAHHSHYVYLRTAVLQTHKLYTADLAVPYAQRSYAKNKNAN